MSVNYIDLSLPRYTNIEEFVNLNKTREFIDASNKVIKNKQISLQCLFYGYFIDIHIQTSYSIVEADNQDIYYSVVFVKTDNLKKIKLYYTFNTDKITSFGIMVNNDKAVDRSNYYNKNLGFNMQSIIDLLKTFLV
jgi:hypothetical protein